MDTGTTARVVGVVGLGVMGKPMAHRLVGAGFEVVVFSRSGSAYDELIAAGARAAESVQEVAETCDAVLTVLPDTPDVESVLLGDKGVLSNMRPGGLVIDLSTIASSAAKRFSDSGRSLEIDVIDAPVSGGEVGAQQGTLSVMCGGSAAAIERALPILEPLSARVVHVGEAGCGQVVKACNQIVVAATLQAMGEALVLGSKAGVHAERIVEALSGGAARCWALEVKSPNVLRRDFSPGFRCDLQTKDLRLAVDLAHEIEAVIPLADCVLDSYTKLCEMDGEDLDHSGVITLIEHLSNHSLERADVLHP